MLHLHKSGKSRVAVIGAECSERRVSALSTKCCAPDHVGSGLEAVIRRFLSDDRFVVLSGRSRSAIHRFLGKRRLKH